MGLKEYRYECDNCGAEFSVDNESFNIDPTQLVMHYPVRIGVKIQTHFLTNTVPEGSKSEYLCINCYEIFKELWTNRKKERREEEKDGQYL